MRFYLEFYIGYEGITSRRPQNIEKLSSYYQSFACFLTASAIEIKKHEASDTH